jgi:hypothetical protein
VDGGGASGLRERRGAIRSCARPALSRAKLRVAGVRVKGRVQVDEIDTLRPPVALEDVVVVAVVEDVVAHDGHDSRRWVAAGVGRRNMHDCGADES